MLPILLQSLIMSMNTWIFAPAPPDSIEIMDVLREDPIEVLVFMARSGWSPDWFSPDSLAAHLMEVDSNCSAEAAWSARLMGLPLSTEMTPALIEFGRESIIPEMQDIVDNQALLDAYINRILHTFAEGCEPLNLEEFVEIISATWDFIPTDIRSLSLEALGKLGIDITGDISPSRIEEAGLSASARYFSTLDIEYSYILSEMNTPLERIYIAGCVSPETAGSMLDDSCWAVRFNAIKVCDPCIVGELLNDSVPYVSLAASIARREAGFDDGANRLSSLAVTSGPVGNMATEQLAAADTVLLRELMLYEAPGRRAAAQTAWLNDSIPVDSLMEEKWISDPYWAIPISWAWYLVDIGDFMKAEDVLLRISTLQENYSDQVLIKEYVALLTDRLQNVEESEEEQESETVEWTQYELPFEPDCISIPDTVVIKTDVGDFTVLMWVKTAPITCGSFWNLAEAGFYEGIYFHRVIPGFVAQAGCPEGVGTGGPGYVLPNERSIRHFGRGVLGMADAGLNTGGSQFFIMLDDHGRLDGRYTAFGIVLNQAELDRITVGTRIRDVVCFVK